jgi:colanic acid biosynthesis protein WcaH
MHISFPYGSKSASAGRRFPLDGVWMLEPRKAADRAQPGEQPGPLDAHTFAEVVANAPLVAIDLIIESQEGEVLLGLRRNPPAQGCWFVPGGRIRKGETLDGAFARITLEELGQAYGRSQARFIDVFEHFYDTNFRGTAGETTHYVVHAYRLRVDREALRLPAQQHSQYAWMTPQGALTRADVHPYTQAYFNIGQTNFKDAAATQPDAGTQRSTAPANSATSATSPTSATSADSGNPAIPAKSADSIPLQRSED